MERINAAMLKAAFLSAAAALDSKKDWINELNVFPVPDGDTGTNMTLTVMAAAREVAALEDPDMETLCRTISSGTLRGARGNSGVITSQLLRGLTKTVMNYDEIDSRILAAAFRKAVDTAYKAVMKPKEGTILTVARGISESTEKASLQTKDISAILSYACRSGDETLARTPDMLPVLKQAGVVDSGGQGLMVMFHAAVDALEGRETEYVGMETGSAGSTDRQTAAAPESEDDIRFGYCTEFIINSGISREEEAAFKAFLESIGDSIVCVADDDLVKVHVHTNDPGKAISRALKYGELSRMKIDNMREEHRERLRAASEPKTRAPRKKNAVIAVSVGEGLSEIFTGLGADHIISGGQTMNPSTEDILKAIENVNADVVYVLPNNKNIILTARQAAAIAADTRVIVIPSKSIPLGVTALMNYNSEAAPEDNEAVMTEALSKVKFCEVTYAVRDTSIDGYEIHNGDIMAIGDNGMLAVDTDLHAAAVNAVKKMIDDTTELVSLYYGEGVTEAEAVKVVDELIESYPDVDFDTEEGDQPVYYYFISVE